MKPGDLEFHEQANALNDRIADEGLRIARENGWKQLEVRAIRKAKVPGRDSPLHCFVLDPCREDEIDEPTGVLLEAARALFALFEQAGTPLTGMTMEWVPHEDSSKFRRSTRYSYQ